jgi:cytochrome c biogenesis protein CcdA
VFFSLLAQFRAVRTLILEESHHIFFMKELPSFLTEVIFVLFGIFASFILREKPEDERAMAHQALAGRNAFLIGSMVLMAGILIQGYSHTVDPWLVIGLVAMIIAKISTRIWSDKNR